MRRSIGVLTALLALGATSALAQPQALDLTTLSCAQVLGEDSPLPPRRLVPAYAGLVAARNSNARLPSDAGLTQFGTALRAGCANDPTQPLAMIAVLIPPIRPAEGDRDMATMTCAALAPIWRREANQIVPFVAGLLAPQGRLAPGAMDRIGNGLQTACREPINAGQIVIDVVALLP